MNIIPSTIQNYCQQHGYTQPFRQNDHWWAFPPNAVIPVQLSYQHMMVATLRHLIPDPEELCTQIFEQGHSFDAKALRQAFQESQNDCEIIAPLNPLNPPNHG